MNFNCTDLISKSNNEELLAYFNDVTAETRGPTL